MRIRKLRLAGFKSFVEPAELRIEPGLTGVVGPNGCGKSNLLEAIRWVMGEGSAKSLRGAGMDDVIFAGTERRPAREFAEVAMLIEADGDEREVVRRIERGAGSAYRIDGRDVRQKDVALLFADVGTGAHSPALVSQGRIGAVIAAKPIERRQMLEEAAGIAGLHVRRRDAEQRLRATEANLAKLDELLAEMAARAGALGRQARAAERYRALSARIQVAEARLIFARWRQAAAAAEAATREAAAAEAAVAGAAERQRAAAALREEAARRLDAARAAASDAREAAGELAHRLASSRAERAAVRRRLDELARAVATIAADRGREDRLALDASGAMAALADEGQALARSIAAAEAETPVAAGRAAAAELATRDAELALARALGRQAAEQADIRVAEAALAAARQRAGRADADLRRLEGERRALADAGPLEAARAAASAGRVEAEAAVAEATRALAALEGGRGEAVAARSRAESEGAAARAVLAALDAELRALSRAEPVASGRRALDAVTAAPGYERALAAALGDDLAADLERGPRRWAGAAVTADDPALPAGAAPLADHVAAPEALARRLAQIGVVDALDGAALAVGQRLVTRDGRLRRWDGYESDGEGAAAAERLIRRNRLAELERQRPEAAAASERSAATLASAVAALAAIERDEAAARRALAGGEDRRRQALRAEDAAAAAFDRRERLSADLGERERRAGAEQAEAADAVATAAEARAALPDGAEAAVEVEALRLASAAAQAALAEVRAAAAALARALEADRRRLDTTRAEAKSWRARAGDATRRLDEMAKREAAIAAEMNGIADRPAALDAEIEALVTEEAEARAGGERARVAEREAEERARATEQGVAAAGEALATAREGRAAAAARAENEGLRRVELSRVAGERFGCAAAVLPDRLAFDPAEVGEAAAESAALDRLSLDRERIGPVNLVAATELAELETARAATAAERDELGQAVHRLRGSIGALNREGRVRLLAAFEAVDGHFRRLFATLFDGGEAHLALVESDDPLEAGLEIMAQPPGKRLSTLTLLSGGEQALTAVALVFGLFLTNPAPICVLDEVDAPLDDANIERFCDLLDRMAAETDTRYLIVTHNPVTMARMHRLFGVTMIERGVSRLVSVDLRAAEGLLAAE